MRAWFGGLLLGLVIGAMGMRIYDIEQMRYPPTGSSLNSLPPSQASGGVSNPAPMLDVELGTQGCEEIGRTWDRQPVFNKQCFVAKEGIGGGPPR